MGMEKTLTNGLVEGPAHLQSKEHATGSQVSKGGESWKGDSMEWAPELDLEPGEREKAEKVGHPDNAAHFSNGN